MRSLKVKDNTWRELFKIKLDTKESVDEIISRLLKNKKGVK